MGDTDLRSLERAAQRGDALSGVQFARALERAGRPDEVIPALLLGKHDTAVRREIGARWDAGIHTHGRFADVPAVREPRVRWLTKLDGKDQIFRLLAHPLSVVAVTKKRTVVFDPESGERRFELPSCLQPRTLREVLLLLPGSLRLTGYDLLTGEKLHETKVKGVTLCAYAAGDLFVTGQIGRGVRAFVFADPRSPPAPAWERSVAGYPTGISASRVFFRDEHQLCAVDHEGRYCWASQGAQPGTNHELRAADEDLAILSSSRDRRDLLAVAASDGAVRWTRATEFSVLGIATRRVVIARKAYFPEDDSGSTPQAHARAGAFYDWAEVEVLDRGTGEPVACIKDAFLGGTALARDALYAVVGAKRAAPDIVAYSLDGKELWRLHVAMLEKQAAHSLAVGVGRLYAAGNGFLACIESGGR